MGQNLTYGCGLFTAMTNIYHRGGVRERQKSPQLPRFSERVSAYFSKSLSRIVLSGAMFTGLAGCVDQYGNSSMSGPNSPDLSGPALMLLGAGRGSPLAVEAGAAITNYDASIRGKPEQTVIVNNNSQGRAYQNPGQYNDSNTARITLRGPDFIDGTIFICNKTNDLNNNGFLNVEEFIGLKNVFSIHEELLVGFSVSGRSVGASVIVKDGHGNIIDKYRNEKPAIGGSAIKYPPGSLKEGLYKAEFFYNDRKVGQLNFEVEN